VQGVHPGLLFVAGQGRGAAGEELLPHAVAQHVHVVVRDVDVDGVVAVGAADIGPEGQVQHLFMLAQEPDVGLVARQAGAVDAALLARAHAYGLSVFHIAHGVGLGVFKGNERRGHIQLRALGKHGVFGDYICKHVCGYFVLVAALLEGDAEHVLVLNGRGDVVGIDAHHVVCAFFLSFQDFQRLGSVARGDDAVGYLVFEIQRRGSVAHI